VEKEVMIVPSVKDMRRTSRVVTLAIKLILVMWLMDTQRPTRWILPRVLATTKTPKNTLLASNLTPCH
jgi:hypothetical protein